MKRVLTVLGLASAVLVAAVATWPGANRVIAPAGTRVERVAGTTTRVSLQRTVAAAEASLAARPGDGDAAVQLADALIRVQRVKNDVGAVITAERWLRETLTRAADPRDAWNYGVIGDAHLELGDYDEAFTAFESMGRLRPGPAAYARIAYALELKGQLDEALVEMRRAADGTSAHDAEGQAWHYVQVGNLLLQLGRVDEARLEYERAAFTFPDHPYALTGIARVKIARGDARGAMEIYQRLLKAAPTPEIAAVVGDLYARLGDTAAAEREYVRAESLERDGWASEEPQPQALARFLAERDRNIAEAVRLAAEATQVRRDIFTMDAAAWAYYKAGRIEDARAAIDQALRTGTRDVRILYHGAAIRTALGDETGAAELLARAPTVETDLLAWPAVRRARAKALASRGRG